MKLVCCVSLCLATISAYSLQHRDHAHNTVPGQLHTPHGSIDSGQGHSIPDSPSLVDALTNFVKIVQGSREADVSSGSNRGANTLDLLDTDSVSRPSHSECFNTAASLLQFTKDALYRGGLSATAVDGIMAEVLHNMASNTTSASSLEGDLQLDVHNHPAPAHSKRGYSRRGAIRLRFSPRFGTKLVPTQKTEDSGPTLLRYGRSDHRGLRTNTV